MRTLTDIPQDALRFRCELQLGEPAEDAELIPIEILARTGNEIEHWYWGRVVHDLAGVKPAKDQIPLDYCHSDDELLGFADRLEVTDRGLVAKGQLVPFGNTDRASEISHKARRGVPYEASIDFRGGGLQLEEIAADQSTEVNGRTFVGPGVVIRSWPLRAIAICPYGADPGTGTQLNQKFSATYVKGENMSETTTAQADPKPETQQQQLPLNDPPAAAQFNQLQEISDDSEFIVSCLKDRLTVEAAQQRFADRQSQRLSDLENEVKRLTDELTEAKAALAAYQQSEPEPVSHVPAEGPNKKKFKDLIRFAGQSVSRN